MAKLDELESFKAHVIKGVQEVVANEILGYGTDTDVVDSISQAVWKARDVLYCLADYKASK